MRVLRVYHMGRDPGHRARERALREAGVDVTLVVPSSWPEVGSEAELSQECFPVLELPIRRPGDVNRHTYARKAVLQELLEQLKPDILDLHEEPFSLATRQWLHIAGNSPVVGYAAQNVDKRFPPPFAQYERQALRRLDGVYPCSRQAAAVARGKGAQGLVHVLPLGYDDAYRPGQQQATDPEILLGLVGRLVAEKGVKDAVQIAAGLGQRARLIVVGAGPEEHAGRALASELGVRAEWLPWQPTAALAELYRRLHVVLVPSRATTTWVEQFGRIIIEGQASGAVIAGYRSGAIAEVAGEAALLAREGDVDGLIAQIKTLLASPGSFDAMRNAGLTRSVDFHWQSVAERQAAFYEQVLSNPVRTRPPRGERARRALARQEFGPSATLAGGLARPFAVPVLRESTVWTRGLGRAVDLFSR